MALVSKTWFISNDDSPIKISTPDLMIPAFSLAISIKLFPRNFLWSNPILVITEIIGLIIFVASNLPPRPTSIITYSGFIFF